MKDIDFHTLANRVLNSVTQFTQENPLKEEEVIPLLDEAEILIHEHRHRPFLNDTDAQTIFAIRSALLLRRTLQLV